MIGTICPAASGRPISIGGALAGVDGLIDEPRDRRRSEPTGWPRSRPAERAEHRLGGTVDNLIFPLVLAETTPLSMVARIRWISSLT
jgi:hypothetical protein